MTKNSVFEDLCELGLCSAGSIDLFHSKVRDRDNLVVYRCRRCGVFLLSSSDHMSDAHYAQQGLEYWAAGSRREAVMAGLEDTLRREKQFRELVANKRWLDIGTGAGGILDRLDKVALEAAAVEPQRAVRAELLAAGHNVYENISDVPGGHFDVITMFHVLEHMPKQLNSLREIRRKLTPQGRLIVEVPHARDFLISYLEVESFKDFTFWSEHLVLHTRESLRELLRASGFVRIVIKGCQRYPLANHLYWLRMGIPGGHVKWGALRTVALDQAYEEMLSQLDATDTLIAYAEAG